MFKADCHVHSRHSNDSETPIQSICAAAVNAGVAEVCLTDHLDRFHPTAELDVPPVYREWLAEIEEARAAYPALKLHIGLEIGDMAAHRDEIAAVVGGLPLDFRLLSLHVVDGVDPYEAQFFADGRTQEQLYARYVEAKLESVLHFPDYDAVAHLGYCGKFAPYPPETRPLRWRHAPDHLDLLLRHIAQNGRALEINTSGLKTTDSTIPGWDILRRFAELGGEFVTLGSDAHTPEFIAYRFEDAQRIAVSAGLRWGVRFVGRKPVPYALDT